MTKATTRTRLLRACFSFLVPVARFLFETESAFASFQKLVVSHSWKSRELTTEFEGGRPTFRVYLR